MEWNIADTITVIVGLASLVSGIQLMRGKWLSMMEIGFIYLHRDRSDITRANSTFCGVVTICLGALFASLAFIS